MKPVYIRDDAESQRQHLSAVGQSLCRRGWLPGTSGSVSVRSGEAVLITVGDLDKRVMTHQDTVMVDPFEGLPLIGEIEWPPDETAIHLALYRRLPDCGAVIYAPALCAKALAPLTDGSGHFGQAVLKEQEMAQTLGLSDACLPALPVVADRLDASLIAEELVAALDASAAGTPPVLLIQQNGLVTWGRDADEALSRLERIEQLSHLFRADAVADEPAVARVNAR
ncbi:class II aldolase/adducin family protein [Streptomyces sp. TRM70350]|uniref:class II aldolase/adducin family protein n=1 Tax=Streptomyces sp. TRM70350 TaxID=2856165 RepID=UPI001C46ACF5|nr:class II aldolase/adducin family protein [Streptomyces sp. TRM70350]MBV7700998.1 class II aldolase/adducin family protein [Streptomyces sp. TRM70350]